MNIRFTRRDLAGSIYLAGLRCEVERARWSTLGGPESAEVVVRGPLNRIGMAAQLLRCGAVISDETGAAAWWGFVNGVDLVFPGGRTLTISLDDLENRIAVRYRDERISPEVNLGWQWQSAWAQDNNSVTEWGKKEAIYTRVPLTPAEAGQLGAALLEQHKRPVLKATSPAPPPGVGAGPSPDPPRGREARGEGVAGFARLRLKGWWSTLNWTYFGDSRGYVGSNGGGAIQNFGNAAATTLAAQSFTVPAAWSAYTVWYKVGKYGAPADNLTALMFANNAGIPGGVMGTSGAVAGATLNGDLTWVRFDFLTPPAMAASTVYWVDLARSGAMDANNYYRVSVDDGLAFTGGNLLIWNGGAWVARVPDADLVFQLTGQAVTTDQIKTMGEPANGFAQFLSGVWIRTPSGISGRQYRDGRGRTGDELQALLDQGTSTGGRLMALVNLERCLVVSAVPVIPVNAASAELVLLASGELRTRSGLKLPGSFNPVGKWARLGDMDLAGGDVNAPGCVLVERAEWKAGKVGITWE